MLFAYFLFMIRVINVPKLIPYWASRNNILKLSNIDNISLVWGSSSNNNVLALLDLFGTDRDIQYK